MGKIDLARVDQRLIHGQVMMTLSQRPGLNSIFVIDDQVTDDPFMTDLYRSAGSRTGLKTIVMKVERALYYYNEYNFREYSALAIAKTIEAFYELAKQGVPLKEFNIGGIAKPDNVETKRIVNAVHLTKEQAQMLKEMHEDFGVEEIYVQATPADTRVELSEVLKAFDL